MRHLSQKNIFIGLSGIIISLICFNYFSTGNTPVAHGNGAQSAYQVQIDNDPAFGSPDYDSGKIISGGTSNTPTAGSLGFGNTTYYLRVRAWDQDDVVTPWQTMTVCTPFPGQTSGCLGVGTSWKTPAHPYPQALFSTTPTNPAVNSPVTFTDTSTFAGAATPRTWLWNFNNPTGPTQTKTAPPSVNGNTVYVYTASGSYSPKLTVTDDVGQTCSYTSATPIGVQRTLPEWREVAPR